MSEQTAVKLDDIDRQILRILQKNARTPLKEIAASVFMSSPAVASRIEKMEKNGLIRGYRAEIDNFTFGYHIKAFVSLEVPPLKKKDVYRYIEAIPNVIECNSVTGDYSLLIEAVFQTTMQLDAFVVDMQKFGHTNTSIVFSTPVEHRDFPI